MARAIKSNDGGTPDLEAMWSKYRRIFCRRRIRSSKNAPRRLDTTTTMDMMPAMAPPEGLSSSNWQFLPPKRLGQSQPGCLKEVIWSKNVVGKRYHIRLRDSDSTSTSKTLYLLFEMLYIGFAFSTVGAEAIDTDSCSRLGMIQGAEFRRFHLTRQSGKTRISAFGVCAVASISHISRIATIGDGNTCSSV